MFRLRTGYVPDLLKPPVKFLFTDLAGVSLGDARLSIPSRFALHEDKFHVILDNRIWLIWFTQEF